MTPRTTSEINYENIPELKEDDSYPDAILSVGPTKTLIEMLLNHEIDINTLAGSQHLYREMDKIAQRKDVKSIHYGGLGVDFHKDSRHRLIEQAFTIDDRNKTIIRINSLELLLLAQAYKSGDIENIKLNATKQIICHAVLLAYSPEVEYRRAALVELKRLYGLRRFNERYETPAIMAIIDQQQLTLPAEAPVLVAKPQLVIDKNQKPTQQVEIVIAKKETFLEKAEPVVVSTTSIELPNNIVAIDKNNNTMEMLKAVQKLLLQHIDVWKAKTTSFLFFGGSKIEHPDHPGVIVKVPNGIARMINILKDEKLMVLDAEVSHEDATRVLAAICKVASERVSIGHRSSVRYNETDRLYNLLATVTATKVSDNALADIAKILPTQPRDDLSNKRLSAK